MLPADGNVASDELKQSGDGGFTLPISRNGGANQLRGVPITRQPPKSRSGAHQPTPRHRGNTRRSQDKPDRGHRRGRGDPPRSSHHRFDRKSAYSGRHDRPSNSQLHPPRHPSKSRSTKEQVRSGRVDNSKCFDELECRASPPPPQSVRVETQSKSLKDVGESSKLSSVPCAKQPLLRLADSSTDAPKVSSQPAHRRRSRVRSYGNERPLSPPLNGRIELQTPKQNLSSAHDMGCAPSLDPLHEVRDGPKKSASWCSPPGPGCMAVLPVDHPTPDQPRSPGSKPFDVLPGRDKVEESTHSVDVAIASIESLEQLGEDTGLKSSVSASAGGKPQTDDSEPSLADRATQRVPPVTASPDPGQLRPETDLATGSRSHTARDRPASSRVTAFKHTPNYCSRSDDFSPIVNQQSVVNESSKKTKPGIDSSLEKPFDGDDLRRSKRLREAVLKRRNSVSCHGPEPKLTKQTSTEQSNISTPVKCSLLPSGVSASPHSSPHLQSQDTDVLSRSEDCGRPLLPRNPCLAEADSSSAPVTKDARSPLRASGPGEGALLQGRSVSKLIVLQDVQRAETLWIFIETLPCSISSISRRRCW